MSNKTTTPLLPKLRFPQFESSGPWPTKELGDCLEYLQPTEYLVSSTAYSDHYETPVVTAGKTFILGFTNEKAGVFDKPLPVIIFDDFTTASQFVDFPFKAKSSAMKILLAKKNANIKFLYESMQQIDYEVGAHGRHWISAYSRIKVAVPAPSEQQKISDCLSSLDELIAAQARKVDALKTHKKGLMQQLFPREGETQPRLRFPEFRDAGEWVEGLISDLASTVMGNAFRSRDFVESGIQVVRIGNLYQGQLQLERAPVYLSETQAEDSSKFGVYPLDLLMSMTGTVGKRDYGFVIQVPPDCKPLLLNQRVMKLSPTVKCDPGFLLQLLKSDRLLDAIYSVPGGTKQANLSAQQIKDLSISYPPKSEQQRISSCLSRLDALIALEIKELESLKIHKNGLMLQLFPSAEAVAA